VDIYEKKTRRLQELESIEKQALKGKISRRQYKVRKRALENRISVTSRNLANLREKLSAAGQKYADMMRQVEVAETRLMGAEADIRRLETRYRNGEISKEAYRRLLNEYNRRRDGARTTIDGVLLRLREEIR
jgi:predicted  nucleic acid-binding Zn-ribbon protein